MINSLLRTVALLSLLGMALASSALGAAGPSTDGTAARAQYNVTPPVAVPDTPASSTEPDATAGPGTTTNPAPVTTPDQQEVEDNNDSGSNPDPDSSTKDDNANGGGNNGDNADNGGGTRHDTESGSSPSATVSSGDLPFTGWAVLPIVLIGVIALLAGVALRRRSDAPHSA